MRRQQAEGRQTQLYVVGPQGPHLLPLPRLAASRPASSASPTGRRTSRPGRSARSVTAAFNDGEVDTVEVVYTQFLSAGSQRVVTRRFMPLDAEALTGPEGAGPAVRVRAGARPDPRTPAAPVRRGPAVRRAARGVGVAARSPAAGDEGGHRQRRGPHRQPEPGDEPGPPGRHHHRDHGDRRRRRGAAAGQGRGGGRRARPPARRDDAQPTSSRSASDDRRDKRTPA